MVRICLAIALPLLALACPPVPVVPPPDASDASSSETSPPPPTPTVDATSDTTVDAPAAIDASPKDAAVVADTSAPEASVSDAAPPPSACVQACAAMVVAGCVQQPTCATTLANVEAHHLILDPTVKGTSNWLKCSALTGVKTAAQVQSHNWSCGPAATR